MRKKERHVAQELSRQIDDILAGKAVPDDDGLLLLATEMANAPAGAPSPTFVRQLRQRLLSSQPSQPARPIWRWSIGAATLVVVTTLLLVLVWNPWSPPSAQEVLARAADAISVQPGQIEHFVMQLSYQEPGTESSESLAQLWIRIEEIEDGSLAGVEQLILNYDADNAHLENPTSTSYWGVAGEWCALQYVEHEPVAAIPGTDERGCLTHDFDDLGLNPAVSSLNSPQDWISALEKRWKMDRKAHPDHFGGRDVYRLEFQGECETLEVRNGTIEREPYACSGAVYIDRETYLLVGGTNGPTKPPLFTSSYTLISYEVLDLGSLDSDPFVWPPHGQ